MKSPVFWDVTPCSPLKINQSFWRCGRHVPPKHRLTLNWLHGVICDSLVLKGRVMDEWQVQNNLVGSGFVPFAWRDRGKPRKSRDLRCLGRDSNWALTESYVIRLGKRVPAFDVTGNRQVLAAFISYLKGSRLNLNQAADCPRWKLLWLFHNPDKCQHRPLPCVTTSSSERLPCSHSFSCVCFTIE
jgi:hypothetical protein